MLIKIAEAIWSGCTLFKKAGHIRVQQDNGQLNSEVRSETRNQETVYKYRIFPKWLGTLTPYHTCRNHKIPR